MNDIGNLDVVETLVDIPANGDDIAISKGERGTVLYVASKPSPACMVEFCDDDGTALATPWIEPHNLKLHWKFRPKA